MAPKAVTGPTPETTSPNTRPAHVPGRAAPFRPGRLLSAVAARGRGGTGKAALPGVLKVRSIASILPRRGRVITRLLSLRPGLEPKLWQQFRGPGIAGPSPLPGQPDPAQPGVGGNVESSAAVQPNPLLLHSGPAGPSGRLSDGPVAGDPGQDSLPASVPGENVAASGDSTVGIIGAKTEANAGVFRRIGRLVLWSRDMTLRKAAAPEVPPPAPEALEPRLTGTPVFSSGTVVPLSSPEIPRERLGGTLIFRKDDTNVATAVEPIGFPPRPVHEAVSPVGAEVP